MKQIIKVLGTSLIIAIVVISVLTILSNINFILNGKTYNGIFEVLGLASTVEGEFYSSSDSAVFESVVASKRPEIYFVKEELPNLVKDEELEILKYFKVKFNCNENAITAESIDNNKLRIQDILDSKGKSLMYLYDKQLKTIIFDNSEIYTFTFYLIDDNQKETTVSIKIPVN